MTVEVIGVDHVFVSVSDMETSERFYDRVMAILGFRKDEGNIGGDPHLFYHNRQMVYSLRPARQGAGGHDPYAPGLHHLCFRVVDEAAVNRAAGELAEAGIDATEPRYYPEYAHDYYATFFGPFHELPSAPLARVPYGCRHDFVTAARINPRGGRLRTHPSSPRRRIALRSVCR